MKASLKTILTQEELAKISTTAVIKIETSLNEAIESIEKENARKFDALVENITKKFDEQVNSVILESVKGNTSTMVDNKFYSIVKDIVNLLENSGITTTEETKRLEKEVVNAENKLVQANDELDKTKEKYNESRKREAILAHTVGMHPKYVQAAVEYFNDKDIRDITAQSVADFLSGKAKSSDSVVDKTFNPDLDLDSVKDAIDEINKSVSNASPYSADREKVMHESVSRGLSKRKAMFNVDTSEEMLQGMSDELLQESVTGESFEPDSREALDKIAEYRDMSYNFR